MALFRFWVLPTLRHSESNTDFHVWFYQIWIFPNQHAESSNTRFIYGPSSHTTGILFQPFLAGFRCRLGSPYLWRVWSCFKHQLCSFFPALVSPHHCIPIHLVLHVHGADLPSWTTSGYLIECPRPTHMVFLDHQHLLHVEERRWLRCILSSGLARTSMLDHQAIFVPSCPHPSSH